MKQLQRTILTLSTLLGGASLLVGCGDDTVTAGGGGSGAGSQGGDTSDGGGGNGNNNNPSFTVEFEPMLVAPGEENTKCVVKKLGNTELAHIHEIHNVLPQGSHHLIVYRTNDTEEKLEPFECEPFVDTLDPAKGSPLMVTQKHDETLTLPDGVAFSLEANVLVRLEMHYINPTPEDLMVSATSTFTTMPDAEFENEAGFLFIGNPDIDIPPHSELTLGPTFMELPPNLDGSKFFGITGHTHQWGTNVTVSATDSENGEDTPVYDVPGWLWSEPATVKLDPPVEIPSGGGFRFTCEWNNLSDQQVQFGESANAEMCFFWAYYYPSQGSFVCAHTDQVPGGFDLCCPGDAFCDQLF